MDHVNVVTNTLGHIVAIQTRGAGAGNGTVQASYVAQPGETEHALDVPEELKTLTLLELHKAAAVVSRNGKAHLVKRAA